MTTRELIQKAIDAIEGNKGDDAINVSVAYAAGWKDIEDFSEYAHWDDEDKEWIDGWRGTPPYQSINESIPNYCHSLDAIRAEMPAGWFPSIVKSHIYDQFCVDVHRSDYRAIGHAWNETIERAWLLALLRAKLAEVE